LNAFDLDGKEIKKISMLGKEVAVDISKSAN